MLYTTFELCYQEGACIESYRKMAKAIGGIKQYGRNTPIALIKAVEVLGLNDAIWALRCTTAPEQAHNVLIEFACRCAEHVLHHYEDLYPTDARPRQAIDGARRCLTDKTAWAAAGDAGDAAWAAGDAARAAAWGAAGDAAWAAARAARAAWAAAWAAARAARAAWAAAWAAGDAAWAAAGDAARDAEIEWQTKTFLALLEES